MPLINDRLQNHNIKVLLFALNSCVLTAYVFTSLSMSKHGDLNIIDWSPDDDVSYKNTILFVYILFI